MSAKHYLRVGFGLILLGASLTKWLSGTTQLVADTLDIFALSDAHWDGAVRAWQAVSVFEALLGLAMIMSRRSINWNISLLLAVLAFFVWDVARFVADRSPDCGCFGGVRIATEWWHVWAKHVVLGGATLFLLPSAKHSSGGRGLNHSA